MTTNRLGTPTTEPISYPTAQPIGGATRSSESVQPSHGRTDGRTDEEDGHLGISGSRNASPAGGPQNSPRITPTGTPKRIQLRRTKGWRKPDNAVVVARPTRFGNPFRVETVDRHGHHPWGWRVAGDPAPTEHGHIWRTETEARARAVLLFGREATRPSWADRITELRGHDLACWCPPGPCHADVLLELANRRPS